jgi:hypothetical protein
MGELSKSEVAELAAYHGCELKGGKIVRASSYEDATGEKRAKALVDYGISGIKAFDASYEDLAIAAGDVEPSLERLDEHQLAAIARDLGLAISGKTNKVKLVVAIREKIKKDALAELEEAEEGPTRSEVINAYGEKAGKLLIDAGYASLSAVAEASDEDLQAIKGIGKGTVKAIREAS